MAEKDQDLNKTENTNKDKNEKETEKTDDAKPKVTESTESKKSPKKSAAKSPAKSPAKSSAKSPVKDAKPKGKSRKKEPSDDGDESEDEELVGTLDQPLVLEGKRDRKSTDFLMNTFKAPQSGEKKKIDIPQGKGETLGSMPRVQFQLGRIVADELKPLHRLLFGRAGTNSEVKRNIRNFNGYDFEKDSKDYKKKLELVDRFTVDSIKRLCEILDIEKKGKKEEILDRIMDFLMKPKASGNPLSKPKKKTSQTKKSETKRKRGEKEKKSEKKNVEDQSESEDEVEDEEEEVKEEEVKTPPKKKAKVSADEDKKEKKESKRKKESKPTSKKDKKVVSIKISPGKKAKKVKKKTDGSESSDDEPLIKKTKKSPPTDDDIVDLVKDLLDGADLEKITMKSVCKQVYDRFPEFDLSHRKEFIKETVKEIIT